MLTCYTVKHKLLNISMLASLPYDVGTLFKATLRLKLQCVGFVASSSEVADGNQQNTPRST